MQPIDAEQLSAAPAQRGRLGRLRGDEHGFTLIEALAATMVLVVGALALLVVFNDSRDQGATGERHQIALMQAEQAIEELRGIPYKNLMLTDGAVDPTGGARVTGDGAQLQVKPELSERLVYPTTEGVPTTQAWVHPVTTTEIGAQGVELELTIHRFVSWRDEECRVADLGQIGVDLPTAVQATGGQLTNLVNSITGLLLNLLGPNLDAIKNRLNNVNARLATLAGALAGVSELDLCDVDLTVLEEVQKLGRLTAELPALGSVVGTLQDALGALNPLLGCLLQQNRCNQAQNAVGQVNSQLNCMFSSTGQGADTSYINGLIAAVDSLADDLADTDRNTKRITVAVTVAPRSGVGPFEPVWASSVVRDPAAGILTSGGASCP